MFQIDIARSLVPVRLILDIVQIMQARITSYNVCYTKLLRDQPYWQKAPGNINLEHWASSCPVDQFRFGEFFDLIGNVWQWTETPISGFDGFEVHPFYDDLLFGLPLIGL